MFEYLQPAVEVATKPQSRMRKAAEERILKTMTTLDPSGTNTTRYQEQFNKWSDTQFESFMQGIKAKHIKLVLYVPNMTINLKMKDIFQAADDIGLELFEHIRLWDSVTKRYYLTPQKYPVLQLPVRRLKQTLMSKISVPENDAKIDTLSGQVVKPDKGSSISSVEMQTILSKGLTISATEFIKVRGGDLHSYADFKGQLQETGAASMNALDEDSRARSSVIFGVYLRSAHIDNNV